jgi:beta-glucosidase
MIPREPDEFIDAMHNLQQDIHMDRIDSSVKRVLQLKENLHMWDETITMENGGNSHRNDDGPPSVHNLELALDMTQQSIVLAQNENGTLPLLRTNNDNDKKGLQVLVTGPTSDSLSYQSGGWTGGWQGIDRSKEQEWFTYGSTVREELAKQEGWHVSYQCGTDILGGNCQDVDDQDNLANNAQDEDSVLDKVKGWVGWGDGDEESLSHDAMERAIHAAKDMDVVVVCVGEENYAEKPGDIRSLRLAQGQYELVAGLRQNTNAKIVLIYFGGRPRLLKDMVVSTVVPTRTKTQG